MSNSLRRLIRKWLLLPEVPAVSDAPPVPDSESRLARRRMSSSLLVGCGMILTVSVSQAAPCLLQGSIISGAGATGRIELCSPELQAVLDKLLTGASASEESNKRERERNRKDLERMLQAVNQIAMRIDKQDTLTRSLAQRLSEAVGKSEASAMREVRRIGDGSEEVLERVASLSKERKTAQAVTALKGAVGDAVAVLDFDMANKLISGIEGLQKQVGNVETKIDGLTTSVREGNDLLVLAEATKTKARGDVGQTRALATLVQQGKTFESYDFSGMGLKGAKVPGLQAANSELSLAIVADADLSKANLNKARLIAVSFERSNLAQAKLRQARGAFANLQQANLVEADLSLSSWGAADLRGANLRSANLQGASLEHADLRGADLTGADLTGAFLGNADLRDSKLGGAKFKNTDVSSTLLSTTGLSAIQKAGLCATKADRTQTWLIIEKIPTSRFEGGYEYRRIFDERAFVGEGGHRPYPTCRQRGANEMTDWNRPVYGDNPELWSDDFSFSLNHALLESAGRREELLDRAEAAFSKAQERKKLIQTMPQFK